MNDQSVATPRSRVRLAALGGISLAALATLVAVPSHGQRLRTTYSPAANNGGGFDQEAMIDALIKAYSRANVESAKKILQLSRSK